MQQILHNLSDTKKLAQSIAKKIKPGMVIALFGDLGAGKTTLIQFIAEKLGVREIVTSPTFVIQKQYQTNKRLPLVHIDCYRLKNTDEAIEIGLIDFFTDDNLCLVEWADRIESLLPAHTVRIYLKYISENQRLVRIEGINV